MDYFKDAHCSGKQEVINFIIWVMKWRQEEDLGVTMPRWRWFRGKGVRWERREVKARYVVHRTFLRVENALAQRQVT